MRTYVDARYRRECDRYRLRATCGHCLHFDPPGQACSIGFPVAPHLDQTHALTAEGKPIWFCKYFELMCEPQRVRGEAS